ncbi:MAG: hypothetical protein ACPGGJ_05160 [Coraliomargarita sp.]
MEDCGALKEEVTRFSFFLTGTAFFDGSGDRVWRDGLTGGRLLFRIGLRLRRPRPPDPLRGRYLMPEPFP